MDLHREILQVLAEHGDSTPVNGVAIYMLLNTVVGGHFEDRYSEEAIRAELQRLLNASLVTNATNDEGREKADDAKQPGWRDQRYRLTALGRSAL